MALTEVGVIPLSATAAEVAGRAGAFGAPVVTHTGCVWGLPNGIRELDAAGLLGADQVHVHCNTLAEDEWQALARNGAKVSISVETELNMGMGRPVFAACERHGIAPTLSCDIISLNSGDLFSQTAPGPGLQALGRHRGGQPGRPRPRAGLDHGAGGAALVDGQRRRGDRPRVTGSAASPPASRPT